MKTVGMKKSMKKAMKKAMKKRSMKKSKPVSKIAKGKRARSLGFSGKKEKTASGLKASELVKNKLGRIVSKKKSALGKKRFASSGLKAWNVAVQKARKALGIKGFAPVGGKTAAGQKLYAKAKSLV